MDNIKNCPECGKIFVKVSRNLCPNCIKKEEEMYMVVRDYIKDNNACTVDKIVEDTNIDEKKILRWMREGRIDLVFHDHITGLTCKRCGTQITIGDFCPNCTHLMMQQLNNTAKQIPRGDRVENRPADSSKEGMFVANRLRSEK